MSTSVGSIHYDLGLDTSKFTAQAAGVKSSLATLGNGFDNVASSLGGVLTKLAVVGAVGAVGVGAMAKASWDQVDAVQQATVGLKAYEKNVDAVNQVLSSLVAYARSDLGVLFNRKDLFQSAQMLKLNGDATANLTEHVKILSRSVGLGLSTWDDLNRVVGRVGSTGRLTGIDFDQLKQYGYKLDNSMRNTNVTFEELFAALDKGIPVDAMEGQANTIQGIGIRLQTAFRGLGDAILGVDKDTGQFVQGGLGSQLVDLMGKLTKTMKDPAIVNSFKQLGVAIGGFANAALPVMISGLTWFVQNAGTIIAVVGGIAAAFVVAKIAAMGFAIQAALVAATPLGMLAWAIAAVVAAIAFLEIKFGLFSGAAQALWGVIGPYVTPALQQLWSVIQTQLLPAFQNLWNQISPILIPVLKALGAVIGMGLIAVIVGLAYYLSYAAQVISWVVNAIANFINWIRNAWGAVAGFIGTVWAVVNTLNSLAGAFFNSGSGLINAFARGITSAIGNAIGAVSGVLSKIRRMLPSSDAKEGPLSDLTYSGKKLGETFALGVVKSQNAINAAMNQVIPNPTVMVSGSPTSAMPIKGDTIVNIGTVQDRSDAQYIVDSINRSYELAEMGMTP